MCAGTQSTLLYEDRSKSPREVHWLDLNDAQPKPADGKRVIHTEQTNIDDMCFSESAEKQLLVVAGGDKGLFAYNTDTDELEWKIGGHLSGHLIAMHTMGVTTDGRGHLFVTDTYNHCIQMFSVSDGQYLGFLVIDIAETLRSRHLKSTCEQIFRFPWRIRWCEETSSLICTSGLK